jgi:hypothetical protein
VKVSWLHGNIVIESSVRATFLYFLSATHRCLVVALVELMQKDSSFPCFAALGEQTAAQLRERFQPTLTHSLVGEHCERLIESSVGSNWTRLYDSVSTFMIPWVTNERIQAKRYCGIVPILLSIYTVVTSYSMPIHIGDFHTIERASAR